MSGQPAVQYGSSPIRYGVNPARTMARLGASGFVLAPDERVALVALGVL
jgi:hypothetical protein